MKIRACLESIGLIACFLCLSGCVFIAGGAVIASAGIIAHDHRSLTQQHEDMVLQQEIVNKLNQNKTINQNNTYIYVSVFYGQVLLSGQVPDKNTKQLASSIAQSVSGVKSIYNQLQISGTTSDLTKLSDSWISTKVKMHLLMVKDLKTNQISVTVNNGVVYLMGHHLDKLAAKWAAKAASKVSGVQKVVLCGI